MSNIDAYANHLSSEFGVGPLKEAKRNPAWDVPNYVQNLVEQNAKAINAAVSKKLGMAIKLTVDTNRPFEANLTSGNIVSKAMKIKIFRAMQVRGNFFLSSMAEEGVIGNIGVNWEHNDGGSNGVSTGRILVSHEGKVKILN